MNRIINIGEAVSAVFLTGMWITAYAAGIVLTCGLMHGWLKASSAAVTYAAPSASQVWTHWGLPPVCM